MLIRNRIDDNSVSLFIVKSHFSVKVSFNSITIGIIKCFLASFRIYLHFISVAIKPVLFSSERIPFNFITLFIKPSHRSFGAQNNPISIAIVSINIPKLIFFNTKSMFIKLLILASLLIFDENKSIFRVIFFPFFSFFVKAHIVSCFVFIFILTFIFSINDLVALFIVRFVLFSDRINHNSIPSAI